MDFSRMNYRLISACKHVGHCCVCVCVVCAEFLGRLMPVCDLQALVVSHGLGGALRSQCVTLGGAYTPFASSHSTK